MSLSIINSLHFVKLEINESNIVWSCSPDGAAIQISTFSAL